MVKKVRPLKLRPSSRDKRRYFLVKGSNSAVEAAILEYIGVLGFAKSGYMKVVTKNHPGFLVGSCLRERLNDVRASLGLAGMEIVKVSGTLKGLRGK